jgi:hypothetical protein
LFLDIPFDWLFSYAEVAETIHYVLPDKNAPILMLGSGNAPFSPDMYFQGQYKEILNIDLSHVVIEQMGVRFPEQVWREMDALSMDFEDDSFPVILDKSLIDTMLCAGSR